MARSATSITAVGNVVRQAQDSPGAVSQNVEIQLTVKASDLLAITTADEETSIAGDGNLRLVFAVALTNDDGTIFTAGGAYLEASAMGRVGLSRDQHAALSNLIRRGSPTLGPS